MVFRVILIFEKMLLQKVIFYKKFKCRKGMKLTSVRKSDRSINFIFNTWAKSRIRDIPTDQRIFNIDTVSTILLRPNWFPSLQKTGRVLKFFYRSELTGFNTKENLDGHTTKLMFLYLEWSTEKPKLLDLKKTWQKAKISGFSKGWKEWLKLRIFLINKARSNWAVFNTKSQILIINLIRISDTETII